MTPMAQENVVLIEASPGVQAAATALKAPSLAAVAVTDD
jgi:hypothetical protein